MRGLASNLDSKGRLMFFRWLRYMWEYRLVISSSYLEPDAGAETSTKFVSHCPHNLADHVSLSMSSISDHSAPLQPQSPTDIWSQLPQPQQDRNSIISHRTASHLIISHIKDIVPNCQCSLVFLSPPGLSTSTQRSPHGTPQAPTTRFPCSKADRNAVGTHVPRHGSRWWKKHVRRGAFPALTGLPSRSIS